MGRPLTQSSGLGGRGLRRTQTELLGHRTGCLPHLVPGPAVCAEQGPATTAVLLGPAQVSWLRPVWNERLAGGGQWRWGECLPSRCHFYSYLARCLAENVASSFFKYSDDEMTAEDCPLVPAPGFPGKPVWRGQLLGVCQ